LFLVALLVVFAGGVAALEVRSIAGRQPADPAFSPEPFAPAYRPGGGPVVAIDEGHLNFHTAAGRYRPFAQLLERDGFRVISRDGMLTITSVRNANVLVIANALGWRGAAAQLMGNDRAKRMFGSRSAFTESEMSAVENWVRDGGALLLVADHAPAGQAAAALASRFGIEMSNSYTEDSANFDRHFGSRQFIVFSRERGINVDHPVTEGVNRVIAFTGQSLVGPPGSVAFLQLSNTARDFPAQVSADDEGRPAGGRAMGIALRHGLGRVVVLGEAAMLASQVLETRPQPLTIGMATPGYDNQRLARNIIRWLASGVS
jgi:hypothetical protein